MANNSQKVFRIRCGYCCFETASGSVQQAGNEIVEHFWMHHSERMEAAYREWEERQLSVALAATAA